MCKCNIKSTTEIHIKIHSFIEQIQRWGPDLICCFFTRLLPSLQKRFTARSSIVTSRVQTCLLVGEGRYSVAIQYHFTGRYWKGADLKDLCGNKNGWTQVNREGSSLTPPAELVALYSGLRAFLNHPGRRKTSSQDLSPEKQEWTGN